MKLIENEWRYLDEGFGIPYPWYTGPCLEWLTTLNFKGKRIWEYGCGDSTTWYRNRAAIVMGVDSNRHWLPRGIEFEMLSPDYERTIMRKGPFDIVIVDGLFRDNCTEYALKELKRGGYLILDNWKQPSVQMEWPKSEAIIKDMDVTIYKEPNHPDWQTAVIRKP